MNREFDLTVQISPLKGCVCPVSLPLPKPMYFVSHGCYASEDKFGNGFHWT